MSDAEKTSGTSGSLVSKLRKLPRKLVVGGVLVLVGAIAFMGLGRSGFLPGWMWGTAVHESRVSVVDSWTKEDEVVLLRLRVRDIFDRHQTREVFGIEIPGTERVVFLRASYDAKLGIDGSRVDITQPDPDVNRFSVTIPEFIFIGWDDPVFETVHEDGGVLQVLSDEIDVGEMINSILGETSQDSMRAFNEDILRESSNDFFTQFIRAIEPSAEVDFFFADNPASPAP